MILFNRKVSLKYSHQKNTIKFLSNQKFSSKILNREVEFDLLLPPNFDFENSFKTIYFNDGQELNKIKIDQMLSAHFEIYKTQFIYIGIYANSDRVEEYGTCKVLDFKNRGKKAEQYQQFIINELMPFVQNNYKSSSKQRDNFIAGFSLGGLSAFDTLWENSDFFSKVGVFSGSFWWRKVENIPVEAGIEQRIMHHKISTFPYRKNLKFWFECGTADEEMDRNKNGIIDVIDDTQDLILELQKKGYSQSNIRYVQIEGGKHNFETWVTVLPYFFIWLVEA